MLVLLDGIADINRLMGMYMFKIRSHIESYGIDDAARAVVLQLKLDMLHILAYNLRCAEIKDIACHEYRLLVAGAEWIEFTQHCCKFRSNLCESDFCVNLNLGLQLIGKDVGRDIFFELAREFSHIVLLECQSDCVGVAAEVFKQMTRGIDGGIDVESLDRTG